MGKPAGFKSLQSVPLAELVEKFKSFPQINIKVGVGWLKAVKEAHDISFGGVESAEPEESDTEAETPAVGARPVVQID